jgi:hypothetical protein
VRPQKATCKSYYEAALIGTCHLTLDICVAELCDKPCHAGFSEQAVTGRFEIGLYAEPLCALVHTPKRCVVQA